MDNTVRAILEAGIHAMDIAGLAEKARLAADAYENEAGSCLVELAARGLPPDSLRRDWEATS